MAGWADIGFEPPDYQNRHHCPKCAGQPKYQYCEARPPKLAGVEIHCAEPSDPGHEHLHCRCVRCGFTWLEKTAEASGKKFKSTDVAEARRAVGA